jgi:hypothetical protein
VAEEDIDLFGVSREETHARGAALTAARSSGSCPLCLTFFGARLRFIGAVGSDTCSPLLDAMTKAVQQPLGAPTSGVHLRSRPAVGPTPVIRPVWVEPAPGRRCWRSACGACACRPAGSR